MLKKPLLVVDRPIGRLRKGWSLSRPILESMAGFDDISRVQPSFIHACSHCCNIELRMSTYIGFCITSSVEALGDNYHTHARAHLHSLRDSTLKIEVSRVQLPYFPVWVQTAAFFAGPVRGGLSAPGPQAPRGLRTPIALGSKGPHKISQQ